MESGAIDIDALSGGFDLQSTLESGQSYLWRREDGRMYERDAPYGGSAWYYTVVDPAALQTVTVPDAGPQVIRARQIEGNLEWEATTDADPYLRELLRLDDDLAAIREHSPDDRVIAEAYERFSGMRLVQDPPFGTLVSFICSAQMRVARIHGMVTAIAREFGPEVEFDGRTYHAFPSPERLADASEADLREHNLGYRAPYVRDTTGMVANGEGDPALARDRPYEEARKYLTRFVGVGDKVADCVLLFSLDHLEAVPLDTWIRTAIEEHFPGCAGDGYGATSRALRERFGGDVAGYVQTYVFYHLRTA
jgi:N-glycosylase/DNA lyase